VTGTHDDKSVEITPNSTTSLNKTTKASVPSGLPTELGIFAQLSSIFSLSTFSKQDDKDGKKQDMNYLRYDPNLL
jgi:hypothetical protein